MEPAVEIGEFDIALEQLGLGHLAAGDVPFEGGLGVLQVAGALDDGGFQVGAHLQQPFSAFLRSVMSCRVSMAPIMAFGVAERGRGEIQPAPVPPTRGRSLGLIGAGDDRRTAQVLAAVQPDDLVDGARDDEVGEDRASLS